MPRQMTVIELIKNLSGLPNDTVVVVPGPDHSFRACTVRTQEAEVWRGCYAEACENSHNKVTVVVIE